MEAEVRVIGELPLSLGSATGVTCRFSHSVTVRQRDSRDVLSLSTIRIQNQVKVEVVAVMANGSATSTVTYGGSPMSPSQYLSSSISSLSSARSQSSWIAKTYRRAAQLYLTRRLSEALSTIEPLISPDERGSDEISNHGRDPDTPEAAPVASASRGTRVKVWSFYLTLINAIIDLGPEEGKLVFGSTRWRAIAAKAREGSIWEEVVEVGYGGVEGDVDGEVVVNLYALFSFHPDPHTNQYIELPSS